MPAWRAVLTSPLFLVAVFLVNAVAALLLRAAGNEPAAYGQLGFGAVLLAGLVVFRRTP